jgi:putative ABC transport system permease protein
VLVAVALLASFAPLRRALRVDPIMAHATTDPVAPPTLFHARLPMNALILDFRAARRQLFARPWFSVTALAVLALGLGACATVFSLLNAVYFKPLGFAEPERLLQVHQTQPSRCPGCVLPVPYATYEALHDGSDRPTRFAGFADSAFAVEGQTNAENRRGALVSGGLFDLLGVAPALGRGFADERGSEDGVPGVLLSMGIAAQRFGAAERALGQPLRIDGVEHRVLGVMPAGFRFPEFADLWVAFGAHPEAAAASAPQVVARLDAAATPTALDAYLESIARRIAERASAPDAADAADAALAQRPFRALFAEGAGQFFGVLLIAVSLVLLVTCANLAGLVLARGAEREAELGVRSALGARRGRLLRQQMLEHLLLSLVGGLLALGVSLAGVRAVRAAMPAEIPYFLDFSPDLRVLGFTLLLAFVAALAFGLLPALRASGANLGAVLGGAGRGGTGTPRATGRRVLVAVEIGLSVLLLGGAGVLLAGLMAQPQSRMNYPTAGLQTATVTLRGPAFADPAARGQALLSMRAALAAAGVPATQSAWVPLSPEAGPPVPGVAPLHGAVAILPGHFELLGLPLRQGRGFTDDDTGGSEAVAIVGESLAAALWPAGDAVGRLLPVSEAGGSVAHRVIGVAADARRHVPGEAPPRELYLPLRTVAGQLTLLARPPASGALEPRLREALRTASPDLALSAPVAVDARDPGRWQPRFFALVLGSFAAMTLLAAVIGLYGLIAGTVTQRRREFGLRMALGARPQVLARAVVGEGLRLALAGGVPALLLTLVAAPLLARLTRVDAGGPPVVLLLAAVFAIAVGVACWLPARRAARVDPMASLRCD